MYKGLIFDLDGTLLDTVEDIKCVLNQSLEKYNLPPVSYEEAKRFVGNGARKLVERAVGERVELTEKVYAYYAENFPQCANRMTKLYGGAEEALTSFKRAGIKLAVVTNKPQGATDAVYAKFLAKFDFCEVLGQTEYYPLKPNPASTLEVVRRFGIKNEECAFIGDGETDVQTAQAAHLDCISVLWGYRTRAQLEAAGAGKFAQSFKELERIVFQ